MNDLVFYYSIYASVGMMFLLASKSYIPREFNAHGAMLIIVLLSYTVFWLPLLVYVLCNERVEDKS